VPACTHLYLAHQSLTLPCVGPAQTQSASISGTVLDAAGAMLPDAVVELISTDSVTKRSTTASKSDVYSITALSVGYYRVTFKANGFQSFTYENVQLQVGQNLTLSPNLELSAVSTSVDVRDTAPPLDEMSAAVGGVVSGEQVKELPINGRNWASLMTQTPGALKMP
jgi:hypothetical protein